jgi:hypothetical protein
MAFYGASFSYGNVSSEMYDLRILDFESGGTKSDPAGSEANLQQKFIIRKPKPYLFGVTRNTPLEISMTVGSLDYISGHARSNIEKWLLGSNTYTPLQIIQEDISDTIFSCIFTKSEVKYIGNLSVGLTLHGVCNAPWGYTFPSSLIKTYGAGVITSETFNFYNYSDDSDYNYPIIAFTTNSLADTFIISNATDLTGTQTLSSPFGGGTSTVVAGPRVFSFTGLSANETITVDCYKQTIVSSTGLKRISNFNKRFFRLLQGNNTLTIGGGISNFTMTYSFAKKVGA